MKNARKKGRLILFNLFLLIVLPMQAFRGFSAPVTAPAICYPPNVSISGQSSNSVSFVWDSVLGASGYKVWYYRVEDHYTSSETTTGNNSIVYSNLPAGTYIFYFATVCGGETSQPAIVDDLILG